MSDTGTKFPPAALALSPADEQRFEQLQRQFSATFDQTFEDTLAPRTVVIVPSLSLDQQVMARISGVHHYEERMLCLLLLLRLPRTRVVYVTSTPISDTIIDYYLHLLPGIPSGHARSRLTLLACNDASPVALTEKILARPRLLERIGDSIRDPATAHITCFTVTDLERKLALGLGLPLYGCDPALLYWGSKSGSRRIFREAGVDMPEGYEDLSGPDDIVAALADLKSRKPQVRRAVVKLNEGFSGEGNAVFDFNDAPSGAELKPWIASRLPDLAFEARGMIWELYQDKLEAMGGIVEEFVEGNGKRSPSVQFRVDPKGRLEEVSTHDQVLGGVNGQVFLGCRFPADAAYRKDIQDMGRRAAEKLAEKGVLGRFGIDFISLKDGDDWRHLAIEINLRKGGTTHPFLMLQFLTDGRYDATSGNFMTPSGAARCYFASDNLENERYRGLSPEDLIDIAVMNGLHFHAATGEGVAFHLIGALSEFGKLGIVCIGRSQDRADALYRRTVEVLDRAAGASKT